MANYKYNGMIPDDDPRYHEGISKMITLRLNEQSKQKSKKSKGKMITKEDELGEERGISVEEISALGDKS